jgi:NitT/TauT family transport system permease protein
MMLPVQLQQVSVSTSHVAEQSESATSHRTRRIRQWIRRAFLPVSLVVAASAIIEALVRAGAISTYVLPAPSNVFVQLFLHWHDISPHLVVTTVEAVSGFAVATVVAIFAATIFTHFAPAEQAFLPLAIVLQTVPIIVIAPILVVLFGTGLGSKAAIAAIITFFPILINMTRGLKSADPLALDLFATLNASKLQTFLKLRFPGSLPYLFTALKIGAANCFIGAIVGEWISADRGIGYLTQIYLYQLNIDLLYATVLASSVAAILLVSLINLLEFIFCPWQQLHKEFYLESSSSRTPNRCS